jgi:hypothetical protein
MILSSAPGLVYLDCCVLLNLYATRRFAELLGAYTARHGTRFAVASRVTETEALWVGCGTDGGDDDREEVQLGPAIESRLLTVESLASPAEHATFVRFAKSLDDGEAATASLALHRAGGVATDDSAAIRLLTELAPGLPILRTSGIVKCWADAGAGPDELRDVLHAICHRSRFVPGGRDPLGTWWRTRMAGALNPVLGVPIRQSPAEQGP